MSQYLSVPPVTQVQGTSNFYTLVDSVAFYSDVIKKGYLSAQQALGHDFFQNDLIFVSFVGGNGLFSFSFDANNIITLSPALNKNALSYVRVVITAAQFNGMYAAPVLLVPAQGANQLIIVNDMQLVMTYNSAAYAAGGVVFSQYDSTASGGGVKASNTQQASDFTVTSSTSFTLKGSSGNSSSLPFSTTVNKGLYLSNATQAFTTGNSPVIAHVHYCVIPTT